MKTTKILLLAALTAVSAGLSSCGEDFLNVVPSNEYTAETYYSSDDAVLKATEPLYGYAWYNYNYRAIIGMGSGRANDGWNPYLNPQWTTFQVTGLDESLANAWSSFYMVVSMSNQLISDISRYTTSSVSEEVKNLAIGEAYLMRATAYFYLVRSWGNVIVYEDNEKMTADPNIPLTKEEDVLKFIIRDLRRAVKLLPAASSGNHANRYTAEVLLAKVLLAESGWNKGSRDEATLQEVIDLCDDVIENGPYELMKDYADLWKYATNNYTMNNSESVLAIRFADPVTGEWGSMNANFSDLAWSGSSDVNVWGGMYSSVDMLEFYNQDPADSIRFQATWCSPNAYYSYWDTGNDLISAADKTAEKGYPQASGYVYTKKHCQLKKWVVGTKADCGGHLAQMASPLNTYLLRYADVYLTKAEACLGNKDVCDGGPGLDAINEIRRRAHVQELKSFNLEQLIRERRIEFCMDFTNWYDMVTWYRWKPQYMLNYFNNKQHRAFMINDGDIIKKEDGTLAFLTFPNRQSSPWYAIDYTDPEHPDGKVAWSDGLRDYGSKDMIQSVEDGFVFDLDAICRSRDGYDPVILTEANIFMPYPESDVIRNPYFKQPAVAYDFGDEAK